MTMNRLTTATALALIALTGAGCNKDMIRTHESYPVTTQMFGCQNSETLMQLVRLSDKDGNAYNRLFVREAMAGRCTTFKTGETVGVDQNGVSQVCLNRRGGIDGCFWTFKTVIEKRA
jgi:hypothetical protein